MSGMIRYIILVNGKMNRKQNLPNEGRKLKMILEKKY